MYIRSDILSYTGTDAQLVLNIVNKNYYTNVDTTNVYESVRLVRYKISTGELKMESLSSSSISR